MDFSALAASEAVIMVGEHGGAGVPRGEETAPGVFGPAGGADVVMDVTRAQTDPVHGHQVADGIARMGVEDHLGLGGGAGREIKQTGIGGVSGEGRAEFAAELLLFARGIHP
jgi:hypothetical protein